MKFISIVILMAITINLVLPSLQTQTTLSHTFPPIHTRLTFGDVSRATVIARLICKS